MKLVRVVAAAIDTKELTLYLTDGTTIKIQQGDPRVKKIVEYVTPIVTRGGIAVIDIGSENVYAKFEEESNGLVKFFKVAKTKLSGFFSKQKNERVAEALIGKVPTVLSPDQEVKKLTSAVDEIMENAQVADSSVVVEEHETVIAVVGNNVVPDVDSIKNQINNSLATGTKGLQRFMERVAAVSAERSHSVEDLMKFLKKGDLPIADDGSIIIYKVLRLKDDRYADCHTGNVPQRVGSYVCMDKSLVDPNRRNECSNGLHVARRNYVSGFRGDVCVIAKVNPEDVIAVPDYDANKMRVCGYHILFELSASDYAKLNQNKPITDTTEGRMLLGRAISGDHPEPIEDVRIGGHKGTNITITARLREAPKSGVEVKEAFALDPNSEFTQAATVSPVEVERSVLESKNAPVEPLKAPEGESSAAPIPEVPKVEVESSKPDVAPVADAIQAVATSKSKKATKPATKPVAKKTSPLKGTKVAASSKSPRQRIRDLLDKKILNAGQAQAVVDIKKAAKKGWDALGVTGEEQKLLEKHLTK